MFGFEKIKSLKVLKHTYRRLVRKYHPDMGGSSSLMQTLNKEYNERLAELEAEERNIKMIRQDHGCSKARAAPGKGKFKTTIWDLLNGESQVEQHRPVDSKKLAARANAGNAGYAAYLARRHRLYEPINLICK